jgi:hypothetical protein
MGLVQSGQVAFLKYNEVEICCRTRIQPLIYPVSREELRS